MFNRHTVHVSGDSRHYHETRITEKRAPTDESIKILREMKQETLDLITDGFLVQGNQLELLALEFKSGGFGDDPLYYAFKLNGQRYEGTVDGQQLLMSSGQQSKWLEKILENLGRNIASQLIRNHLGSAFSRWTRT